MDKYLKLYRKRKVNLFNILCFFILLILDCIIIVRLWDNMPFNINNLSKFIFDNFAILNLLFFLILPFIFVTFSYILLFFFKTQNKSNVFK